MKQILEEEPQIVVGTLLDPYTIKTKQGSKQIGSWDYRAMWSFLRLQFGRPVDTQIRNFIEQQGRERHHLEYVQMSREQRAELMQEYFGNKLQSMTHPRNIQFIIDQANDIRAIASTKHLLVPPSQVYDLAQLIVEDKHPELAASEQEGLEGFTYDLKDLGATGFNLGLQVYGGDIFTRRAISLSSWLRVKLCFNPLSWLGTGSLASLTSLGNGTHERMLRIKVLNELKPRLAQAIELQVEKTKSIQEKVELAKKRVVKRSDAEVIMAALGMSYGLGGYIIDQVSEQLESEEKTQWGMAMASSWVASHGKFKEKTEEKKESYTVQKLSTISGAALLINNPADVKAKSVEWLRSHIQLGESKSLDKLAERLKLWEKKQP